MDQLEYYISTNNFEEFYNSTIIKSDSINSTNISDINNIKKMKEHIDKMHAIIFKEIAKKGINTKLIRELKQEINYYDINK